MSDTKKKYKPTRANSNQYESKNTLWSKYVFQASSKFDIMNEALKETNILIYILSMEGNSDLYSQSHNFHKEQSQ